MSSRRLPQMHVSFYQKSLYIFTTIYHWQQAIRQALLQAPVWSDLCSGCSGSIHSYLYTVAGSRPNARRCH